jgi:hypothetical protein
MVDESLLHEIFSAFGSVNSCKIQSDQTGVAGYVGFDDYSEAWWPPAPPPRVLHSGSRCGVDLSTFKHPVGAAYSRVCVILNSQRGNGGAERA